MLTVCLLVYHEAENLKWLLPELKKVIDSLNIETEYLIVDSATPTDNTPEIVKNFGARYVNQTEPNYGGAIRTAIREANGDAFLLLDADGSQEFSKIPDMWAEYREGNTISIGSRYVDGGSTDDKKSSQVMSRFLNSVYTKAIGVKLKDISGSLKIYPTSLLKKAFFTCEYYDITEELVLKAKTLAPGIRFREIPISFQKRKFGESKRSLTKFIINFAKTLIFFIVFRFITRNGYVPKDDDLKARKITDVFVYFCSGVATTIINFLTFGLCSNIMHYIPANIISWAIACLAAYFMNKLIVFDKWDFDKAVVSIEIAEFYGGRIITLLLETGLLYIGVDYFGLNTFLAKAVIFFIVIIANFFFGKMVFRKERV